MMNVMKNMQILLIFGHIKNYINLHMNIQTSALQRLILQIKLHQVHNMIYRCQKMLYCPLTLVISFMIGVESGAQDAFPSIKMSDSSLFPIFKVMVIFNGTLLLTGTFDVNYFV
eukprot:UN03185